MVEKLTTHIQKNKTDSCLLPCTKTYSHGLRDLPGQPETLRLPEETRDGCVKTETENFVERILAAQRPDKWENSIKARKRDRELVRTECVLYENTITKLLALQGSFQGKRRKWMKWDRNAPTTL